MRDDEGKRIIENYLLEVSGNLPQRVAREVIPELRSHLIEEASEGGEVSAQGARRAVSRMGDPKSIAQEYLEEYKAEYEGEVREEKTAYPRGREVESRREFAGRWLRSRRYHQVRFYISPSILRWILLPAVLSIVGTVIGFITTSFVTGQIATPMILLGGVTAFIVLNTIYYFAKMYVLETLRVIEGTLKTYEGQRVSIDELSDDLGMRRREIRAAIADLRADGKIKVSYDHLTGDIIVGGEARQPARRAGVRYCSYCGAGLPGDAVFCPNCGASIEQGGAVISQPAGPQPVPTRARYESRRHGSVAGVVIALLVLTIVGLAGVLVAVAILVPGSPVSLAQSQTVPQVTGVDTVNFTMTGGTAGVNLNFADLTDELVVLNTSVTGRLSLFDQRDPNNMSSFVTWAFNYAVVGNAVVVTSNLAEVQSWPSGVSMTCDLTIDSSLNTSVSIHTVTGGIVVNTVSGVVLKGLSLVAVTGGADVNLAEGVSLEGNTSVKVTTGGIDFVWRNLDINGNIGVTLSTVTGGIDATVTQNTPLNGNVSVKASCTTGGIAYDTVIQHSIGATIRGSASTGGISVETGNGFSYAAPVLQSNNYPAASNFNVDLKTLTGGISMSGTSTP